MAVWDELMQWRHCVCADIVRMCNLENSSPALKQLSDLASQHLVWTSHKLASVARKQGLYQLSRQTLDNLQNKSQLSRQLNEEVLDPLPRCTSLFINNQGQHWQPKRWKCTRFCLQGSMLQPVPGRHVYDMRCSIDHITRATCYSLYSPYSYRMRTRHVNKIWDGRHYGIIVGVIDYMFSYLFLCSCIHFASHIIPRTGEGRCVKSWKHVHLNNMVFLHYTSCKIGIL